MTRERWQKINALFDRLVELSKDEQIKQLEADCAEDTALYDTVKAMLDADPDLSFLLEAPFEDLLAFAAEAIDEDPIGKVDSYRLVRRIGEGGMGVVYEAERDDGQFEKRVALKRIKRGMDTDEIVRRFRYERQILASLDHPHIARLLDGGIFEDRPYFVMEFVEGTSIIDYADEQKLPIKNRLRLFCQVCVAVQHAHQKLVVHRDLKPSNILVTPAGDVKLLDFGIAKVLSDDGEAHPYSEILTKTGHRVLTPAYASPEQRKGEPVSTATDVYALGVVLYELITGSRPFEREHTDETIPEAVSRPSAFFSSSPQKKEQMDRICSVRGGSAIQLLRMLRGDIDTIVLKALQPDVQRRYQTAEQLLEDIRRYLAGLPVLARPDTLSYRSKKFIKRYRFGVAVGGFVFVLLVAFSILMVYQQSRTAYERDKAEQVSSFLEGMFAASDPFSEERLDTMRVNALLSKGAAQVEVQLDDQPLVKARMQQIIGRVQGRLGLYDAALEALIKAAQTQRLHASDQDLAETLVDLGDIHFARGEYLEAVESFREALKIRIEKFGGSDSLVAASKGKLGYALHAKGELDEAEELLRSALDQQKLVLGADHPEVAIVMSRLASLLEDKGYQTEAEELHVSSLTIRRKVYGQDHPNVAMGLKNLALFLRSIRRYDAAEPYIREAIAIDRSIFDEHHPHLVTDLNILASILRSQGDYEGATEIFEEVLASRKAMLGNNHPDVSITLDSYARVLKDKGDFEKAEQLQREAIAIALNAYGEEHMAIAITKAGLASILSLSGDIDGAVPVYKESLELYEALLSEDHPNVAVLRSNYAGTLVSLGRLEEAEELLLKSFEGIKTNYGIDHRLTQNIIKNLIDIYAKMGNGELEETYRIMMVEVAE